MKMKGGKTFIYRLYWANGEHEYCYIGQSQERYNRYTQHRYLLSIGKHSNKGLQKAYNICKLLPDFELLEYVENPDFANTREAHYLQMYWPKCFNRIIPSGVGPFDFKGVIPIRKLTPVKPTDKRLKANRINNAV